MKNLEKRVAAFVLALSCCAGLTSGYAQQQDVHAETIAELQEKKEANNKKIAEYEAKLAEFSESQKEEEAYQAALQDKIDVLQENMGIIDGELNSIKEKLFNLELDISEMEDTIDQQEVDIDQGLEEFKLRLRAMYVNGNDSLASALVGATDFYDLLSKYEMISCIARHDDALVTGLQEELESYNANLHTLERQKADQEQAQAEAESKREEMDASMEELNKAVADSEAEKERLEAEKQKADQSIEDLKKENEQWDKAEQEIRDAIAREEKKKKEEEERRKQEEAAQQQQQTSSSGSSSGSSGETSRPSYSDSSFIWPCPSCYYISSYYGYRWGRLHKGLDIAAGGGSAIVASRSGTVIACYTGCTHNYGKESNCCGNGYGNYVIISHDGTYSTLYGHMQSVYVSVGDTVSQGQTIGEVGTTGHSTGFHLHFEIREYGTAVDPSGYLNY